MMCGMDGSSSMAALRTALELHPHPTVVHDRDGRLVAANAPGDALLRATVRCESGAVPWEEDWATAVGSVELQLVCSEGRRGWFAATSHLVPIDGDDLLLTALVDLTDRHERMAEMEAARQRDLAHTELIYEYGRDVVLVLDADATFRFIGPSSLDVMGYDRHDMIGTDGFDLVHPDDQELARSALAGTVATPGLAPPLHLRIRDGQDRWRPVEVVARNLLDVPDVAGIVITARDRSDLVRAAEELERSERRLRALIDAMPDVTLRLEALSDDDYLCSVPTEQAATPDFVLERSVRQIFAELGLPDVADEAVRAIDAVVSGSDPDRAVRFVLDFGDGPVHFEGRFGRISDVEAIAIVRDVSDLQRAEQQRIGHERELLAHQARLERSSLERELERASRAEAMGYLAATMAHDVNNLLGVINNYAGAIRGSTDDATIGRDAEEISAAVSRGAELTQRLLQVGRRPAEPLRTESVRDLVAALAESLRRTFDGTGGIELLTDLPDHPAPVRGSRPRLEQAVMNLVLNARDAAEAWGGCVRVRLAVEVREVGDAEWRPEALPAGGYVIVSVTDGGGIPEPVRARMFEPFFSTKAGANSGLGLPIVHEVALLHRGGVGIHNVELDGAAGTRMELWLPLAGSPGRSGPPRQHGSAGPVRVLLVDDDDDVRRSTRHLLEGLGHAVLDVPSGPDAVAALEAGESVHLVLTDVRMADGSGTELARRVRLQFPGVPVVFVTGYTDDVLTAPDLSEVPVLAKPYLVEELAALIDELVEVD